MIEKIINVPTSLMKEVKEFWYLGKIDQEYCLKMRVIEEDIKFPECKVIIRDSIEKRDILRHRFLKKGIIKFNTNSISKLDSRTDTCIVKILVEYPHKSEGYHFVNLQIYSIKVLSINNLQTSEKKKKELFEIIDHFLKENYKNCINEISVFGEYIAREFARKLKKQTFSDFGSAVDALSHHKMNKKGKVSYSFIGAMLWPLYYVRNQKLHPYSEIDFNKSLCLTLLRNLTEIINYLSQNQFKF
jgi:hypothetical protein